MSLFRMHIRPKGGASRSKQSFEYCLSAGLLGVGWRANEIDELLDWDDYVSKFKENYLRKLPNNVSYIKKNVKEDDLIWTRDTSGKYYIAKVVSGWEYLAPKKALVVDIVNTVKCRFVAVVDIDQVPGKVIANFRASRTIQRVANPDIEHYTKSLWNKLSRTSYFKLEDHDKETSFFDYLNDEDIEDIIFVKLQMEGWIVVPGSRKKDTMKYEFYLINRTSGERAIVQAKSGKTRLNPSKWEQWKERVFLFQSSGLYECLGSQKVICLEPDAIKAFVTENLKLLPAHLGYWVEYTNT
jgi:hypothetical protein